MIRFECDYGEGCHPAILKRLGETNWEQTPGYGEDVYCQEAASQILAQAECQEGQVHFLVGGTQVNLTVIASILRPHQGVIAAESGHINVHETGAIEATGHKVLTTPSADGKISAGQVEALYNKHWQDSSHEHMVQPGMVYISQSTENGTVYTKAELTALSEICRKLHLPLFLDGARLSYALAACDLSLADIARLCDVFYIGGTKCGALFGEAVVITNPALQADFRYMMKRQGAMLAKGRLLGLQFAALLEDDCYWQMGRQAVAQAMRIKAAFAAKGCPFRYDSPTNQQFPILTAQQLAQLGEKYTYSMIEPLSDGRSVVRFCTSWATKEADVESLIKDIQNLPTEE